MTNQHPITPPTELVSKWRDLLASRSEEDVLIFATQWGANQELEACCALMDDWGLDETDLRFARRPNSPSLKEQALALINSNKPYLDDTAMDIIRRALEALSND